jgi:hypothetical protein
MTLTAFSQRHAKHYGAHLQPDARLLGSHARSDAWRDTTVPLAMVRTDARAGAQEKRDLGFLRGDRHGCGGSRLVTVVVVAAGGLSGGGDPRLPAAN